MLLMPQGCLSNRAEGEFSDMRYYFNILPAKIKSQTTIQGLTVIIPISPRSILSLNKLVRAYLYLELN